MLEVLDETGWEELFEHVLVEVGSAERVRIIAAAVDGDPEPQQPAQEEEKEVVSAASEALRSALVSAGVSPSGVSAVTAAVGDIDELESLDYAGLSALKLRLADRSKITAMRQQMSAETAPERGVRRLHQSACHAGSYS